MIIGLVRNQNHLINEADEMTNVKSSTVDRDLHFVELIIKYTLSACSINN